MAVERPELEEREQEQELKLGELEGRHPAEIAQRLEGLPEEGALRLLRALPHELATAVLESLPPERSAQLLSKLAPREAGGFLEEMSPDDAVDVLERLPRREQAELLEQLPREEAQLFQRLITYPPDTAVGIMSPEVVALSKEMTVEEAIERLRRAAEEAETIYYAYVVDREGRLLGVLTMRDLILSPPERRLEELMITDVVKVEATQDVEEVARLFDRYNFLALPVVDSEGRLLGIVTMDDVLDVMQREATEDMHKLVGVAVEEQVFSPIPASLKRRLPWLYINLLTAFVAAGVVALFEGTIARMAALAVFMPIIAGQGGNAGVQTVTVIVRGIALGEIEPGEGGRALAKELALGALHGLLIGAPVAVVAALWQGDPWLGLVVGLAMFLNLIIAGIFGAAIPLGLRLLGLDPALSASIFLTTATDVFGFLFLLGLATFLLLRLQ